MFERYFLPAYLFVYISGAFLWRSYLVWRRTGINPVTFKDTDSAHDFIGRVFRFVFGMVVVAVLLYSFFPAAYAYTLPITWLEHRWLRWTGLLLLLVSLVWTLVAQAQMGTSWRIGVDHEHHTPLVQKGVFSISRNPIFLGVMVTLVGLFLTIPSALTLVALLMGPVVIGIQVRLEEEHLKRTHPEEYLDYSRRVPRWF